MNLASLIHITLVMIVVMDPPGNVPVFMAALKQFEPKRQRFIIWREMVVALIVMVLFLFAGEEFLSFFNISATALKLAGGVILFLLAIQLLFSRPQLGEKKKEAKEPFIIPLAIPAVAGPGILTTISLYGSEQGKLPVLLGIILAWLFTLPWILLGSFLKKLMGDKGLSTLASLFGYLIILFAVNLLIDGITSLL